MFAGAVDAPWNIGGPQPVLAALLDDMRSPVLDVGCGIGETSLALAARGREVVGIDLSPAAIGQARRAAAERGLSVEFAVADAADFGGRDGYFATVVDSSLLHSLPVERRRDYLRCIARAARPGAQLFMSVFDTAAPFPRAVRPNAVSEPELRATVGEFWTVDNVVPAGIRARVPAALRDGLRTDEQGFVVYPSFLLHAYLPGS
jgi:SAM-dependent methyltransferase